MPRKTRSPLLDLLPEVREVIWDHLLSLPIGSSTVWTNTTPRTKGSKDFLPSLRGFGSWRDPTPWRGEPMTIACLNASLSCRQILVELRQRHGESVIWVLPASEWDTPVIFNPMHFNNVKHARKVRIEIISRLAPRRLGLLLSHWPIEPFDVTFERNTGPQGYPLTWRDIELDDGRLNAMSKLRKREIYDTIVAMIEATFAMMAAHRQVDDGYAGVTLHGIKMIVELVRDLIAESENPMRSQAYREPLPYR